MIQEVKNKSENDLEWTGERIIPEEDRYMFRRHLKAYQFAMNFCQKKIILDMGCGEGYGSYLLAEAGAKVIGIDISEEAVRHARDKYVRENLSYRVMDVTHLDFVDDTFDIVVSFQVIEHLNNALRFLKEIKRVLKKDGYAIISTPNKSLCNGHATGKYHVKEYHYNEFIDLLNTHLGKVEYYGIHLKGRKDSYKLWLLDLMLKLDIFKIRRLFSSIFRKKILVSVEKAVSFDISEQNLKNALDIIGIYRRG